MYMRETQLQPVLAVRLFAGLTWTAFALVIGLARPEMSAARLLSLAGLSIAVGIARSVMYPVFTLIDDQSARVYGLLLLNTPIAPALVFHGLYRFPPGANPRGIWAVVLIAAYCVTGFSILAIGVPVASRYAAGTDTALFWARAAANLVPADGHGTRSFSRPQWRPSASPPWPWQSGTTPQ
jgi:hypothetical protein